MLTHFGKIDEWTTIGPFISEKKANDAAALVLETWPEMPDNFFRWVVHRKGVCFIDCLHYSLRNEELISEYTRLNGVSVATLSNAENAEKLVAFVWDAVFLRF